MVELGRLLTPEFLDGLAFVAMADVTEPKAFLPVLAGGAGREGSRGTDARRGGSWSLIGDRTALLLLDNLEQVVAAASDVAGLVEGCPDSGS